MTVNARQSIGLAGKCGESSTLIATADTMGVSHNVKDIAGKIARRRSVPKGSQDRAQFGNVSVGMRANDQQWRARANLSPGNMSGKAAKESGTVMYFSALTAFIVSILGKVSQTPVIGTLVKDFGVKKAFYIIVIFVALAGLAYGLATAGII